MLTILYILNYFICINSKTFYLNRFERITFVPTYRAKEKYIHNYLLRKNYTFLEIVVSSLESWDRSLNRLIKKLMSNFMLNFMNYLVQLEDDVREFPLFKFSLEPTEFFILIVSIIGDSLNTMYLHFLILNS